MPDARTLGPAGTAARRKSSGVVQQLVGDLHAAGETVAQGVRLCVVRRDGARTAAWGGHLDAGRGAPLLAGAYTVVLAGGRRAGLVVYDYRRTADLRHL